MTPPSPHRGPTGPTRAAFAAFVGLFLLILGGVPGKVRGQAASVGSGCQVPHFAKFTNVALSNGSRITYFSFPTIVCSEGTRITADSAVVYEATTYTQLFRNVVFEDADSRLTASEAHYFDQERRLRAWGDVVLNDHTEGSIIRGDTMILIRAGEGRPMDQLTVLGRRPHATLYPTRQPVSEAAPEGVPAPDSIPVVDAGNEPLPRVDTPPPPVPLEERVPYEIEARRIFLEGSRYFRAVGSVTIDRDSVNAVADSVEYDGERGTLSLERDARLVTGGLDLSAHSIQLDIPQDEIREVLARRNSVLEGEDLKILAPTINLFLTGGRLQRLVALRDSVVDRLAEEGLWVEQPHPAAEALGLAAFPIRPHTFAQDFLLWADSIEVLAPDEVLQEVWAMGAARGESLAGDSLNTEDTPDLIRRDWLEGDTVVAVFVPNTGPEESGADPASEAVPPPLAGMTPVETAPADSSRYRLDRLVARVRARSLYRMAPSDSTGLEGDHRRAIHYVVGEEITILMSEGEVDRMEVTGTTRGIHLEPVAPLRRGGGDPGGTGPPVPPPVPPDTVAVPARAGGGRR